MTRPTGNKRGRTSTKALKSITENRSVGRPKGDAAIINEYKLRMLNSPKSAKVLYINEEINLKQFWGRFCMMHNTDLPNLHIIQKKNTTLLLKRTL